MSRTIDERVVEMRFDNQKFEDNVQTSLGTLEKLKKALKLDDAAKGLEEVEQASRKVKLNGLSSAVETVSLKFSALDVAAARVFQRLTDAAIDTGRKMVNALAFQSAKDGFAEYELKMGSVQTIMAGTGESLETVNGYLEELNKYSDQTIYSFSDMTNNIGKFTNAGVKLDKAVLAIKGVSNVAAVSGATAAEASRAMYNFSQALSAGYVKLIDWKSIENANMATQEFKQQLLDTAIEMGTIVKYGDQYATVTTNAAGKTYQAFDATSNFNDSLAYQWMTTDVLTSTLAKYADETTDIGKKAYAAAQDIKTFSMLIDTLKEALGSGWAQTWELLIGDFNEAKALFTDVGNELSALIETSSEARNNVLYEGMASGWKKWLKEGIDDGEMYKTAMMETAREQGISIDEMVEQAGSLEKTFQNGWITNDLLAASVDKLVSKYDGLSKEEKEEMGITQAQIDHAKELQQKLKDGTIDVAEYARAFGELSGRENLIEAMKNAFHSLMDIVRPVKEAFRDIFPPLTGERLKEFTVKVRELTERFKVSEETAGKIRDVFGGVFAVVRAGIEIFKSIGEAIGQALGVLAPGGGRILDVLATIGSGISRAAEALTSSKAFADFFTGLGDVMSSVVQRLSSWVKPLADFISDFTAKVREMGSLKEGIQWAWQQITAGLNSLKSRLPDLSGIGKWFTGLWDGIMNGFSAGSGGKLLDGLKNGISSVWKGLLNWFSGIGSSEFLQGIRNRTVVLWSRMTEFLSGLGIQLPSFEKLGATFEKLWGKIKSVYDKVINSAFVQKVKKILTGLKNSFVGFVTGMTGKLPRFTGLGNIFTKVWGKIQQVWNRIVGSEFLRNVQTGLGKLKTAFLDFVSRISVKLPSFETLGGIFAKGWEAIRSGFEAIGQSEFIQKAKAGLVQLKDRFIEFITGMNLKLPSFEALGEKLQSVWAKIKAVFSTVGGWLGKAFQPISDFIGKFKEKLSSFDSVGEAMEWAWVTAKDKLNGILESVKSWFASIDIWALIGKYWYIPAGLAVARIVKLLGNIMTIMKGAFAEDLAHLNESKAKTPIGKTVMQIAGALLMVAGALYLVASIDEKKLWPAVGAIAAIVGVMTALSIVIGLLNKFTGGGMAAGSKGMLEMGLGILAIVGALKLLEMINMEGLSDRLILLGGIMAALVLSMAIVNATANSTGGMTGVLKFAGAVAILALTLKLLDGFNWQEDWQAAAALGAIMVVLAGAMALVKLTNGSTKGVLSFALATGVLVLCLKSLGGMDKSKLIQGGIALGAMIAALTGAMYILGKVKVNAATVVMLGVLTASIWVFGSVMQELASVPWTVIASFGGAFAAMILALAGAIAILGKLDTATIVKGEAAVTAIVGLLGVVAIGLAELAGGAVAGISTSLFSAINTLKLLSNSAGQISQDNVDNAITAIGKLTTMTAETVFTFNGDVVDWGKKVTGLGDDLYYFYIQTKDLTADTIQGVIDFSAKLQEIYTNLTSIGDITNYESVSKALVNISSNLGLYSENLKDVDVSDEGTEKAVASMGVLEQIAQATPTTEALDALSRFSGEGTNLTDFGNGLYTLTSALARYASQAAAVRDTNKVEVFNQILSKLAALKSSLEQRGILDFFLNKDQNGLTELSQGITSLINPLVEFTGLADGVGDIEKLSVFTDIIDQLAGIKTKMEENQTLWNWISDATGHDTLTVFGTGLSAFGEAFKDFVGKVDGLKFDSKSLTTAVEIIGQLALAEATLGPAFAETNGQGMYNLIAGNGSTIKGLSALIGALIEAQTGAAELDTELWNDVAGILTDISSLTAESLTAVDDGAAQSLAASFGTMLTLAAAELTSETHKTEFSAAGTMLVTELMAGFGSQLTLLETTAGNLAVTAANAMSGKYQSFHTAGFNAVMGFANAIAEYTWYAERQASNMAQLAANAAMRALDEHSPSRVTYGIGQYFSEGFANGISAYASGAVHAADGMAEGAAAGLNNAIGKISAMLDGSIDTTPTIRPVVDLSSAASGAAALNNLFAMNPSMSSFGGSIALQNVGELRLDDGRMSRGTDNQNVVDAITRLESRFNNLSEAVSHMQIVLDSGTLVGETRAQMDQQLGFTAAMRERGN